MQARPMPSDAFVCPSVTFVDSVETNNVHFFTIRQLYSILEFFVLNVTAIF